MTQRHDSRHDAGVIGTAEHSARRTDPSAGASACAPAATSSIPRDSPAAVLQRAASAFSAALETGRVRATPQSAAEDGATLTFVFADDQQLQEACGAWKTYLLALIDAPASAEATAAQRAAALIGQALFNDPSIPLAEIAARLHALRRKPKAANARRKRDSFQRDAGS